MNSHLYDRTTIIILLTSLALTVFCISPDLKMMMPFWIIARGMFVADTFFHEIGHSIFGWLLGHASIPAIFTIFGSDQAGGVTIGFDRSWALQVVAYLAMIYACVKAWDISKKLFAVAVIFTVIIMAFSISGHYRVAVLYMGHGTSILIGGFFLFRGIVYADSRNQFERWLNAFFGMFLIGNNFFMSWGLKFDQLARSNYSNHEAFGLFHNDFRAITSELPGFTVDGIAIFTMILCVMVTIGAFICASSLNDRLEIDERQY